MNFIICCYLCLLGVLLHFRWWSVCTRVCKYGNYYGWSWSIYRYTFFISSFFLCNERLRKLASSSCWKTFYTVNQDQTFDLAFRVFSELCHYCTLESSGELRKTTSTSSPVMLTWSDVALGWDLSKSSFIIFSCAARIENCCSTVLRLVSSLSLQNLSYSHLFHFILTYLMCLEYIYTLRGLRKEFAFTI